jgi:hypothetical protein
MAGTSAHAALAPKSKTAAAIHYALALWDALARYLDDGRIEMDNLIAERALQTIKRANSEGDCCAVRLPAAHGGSALPAMGHDWILSYLQPSKKARRYCLTDDLESRITGL